MSGTIQCRDIPQGVEGRTVEQTIAFLKEYDLSDEEIKEELRWRHGLDEEQVRQALREYRELHAEFRLCPNCGRPVINDRYCINCGVFIKDLARGT